ncbi:hypothetical protein CERZMDRAFT_119500 [Cercospora zeae-maydis SCOH1-5]|uniref:Uncharacterized protein n=1 Tax=Cercospora zeae-maydis SCOH1-5 TaxID=717836 RepID=A0A6A6FW89_9PEZI|nr:hypothetical protein CERZMDRAFT_119500 [Cercospora zeae-maydis SCOH1-5]
MENVENISWLQQVCCHWWVLCTKCMKSHSCTDTVPPIVIPIRIPRLLEIVAAIVVLYNTVSMRPTQGQS